MSREEKLDGIVQMQMLWAAYQKAKAKLLAIDDWWDKMEVEKHFQSSRWYYAHRKLRKCREEVKDLHKRMFYLLVATDGNYEPFGSDSMYAEDIYKDFMRKYSPRSAHN